MTFILYFFRVPVRRGDISSEKAVTSVADGEVVIVEKVFECLMAQPYGTKYL